MKAFLKVLLFTFFLVMVIAVGVLVAIPIFLDPNDHKDWIVEKVQAQTGRKFELPGPIELTWYPWLGLTVQGVTLGNPPGFADEPFLHADLLQVRVKLLPLLRREIEMDTVRIHGATVNLAVNEDGKNNWADLARAEEQPQEYQPMRLGALAVGGVDVRDARFSYVDRASGVAYRIENLAARTGELALGEPIDVELTARFASVRPALDGEVQLTGTVSYDASGERFTLEPFAVTGAYRGPNVPDGRAELALGARVDVDLGAGTVQIAGLDLHTLDTSVTGRLDASRIDTETPAVEASLAVQGKDMATLFRIAEVGDLAAQIARLPDRDFDLRAGLAADMKSGEAKVSDLSLALLGAEIKGQLEAAAITTDAPAAKGTLTASGPDLPTLLAVVGQLQGGGEAPLARLGKALAGTAHKRFDVRTRFDADMKKGTVRVPELDAQLVGARIKGNLDGSGVGTDKSTLKGELEASGPDLPALLLIGGHLQDGEGGALLALARELSQTADKAFNLKTRFDVDLGRGDISLPQLAARGAGVELDGTLEARGFGTSKGTLDGRLKLAGKRLKPWLAAFDQAALGEVVQALDAEAAVQGRGNAFTLAPLAVRATVAGKDIPGSPVAVTFDADASADLDAQTLALANVKLRGLGLDVGGRLDARRIREAPEYDGQLTIAPFDLRRLLAQLNQEVPKTADDKVLRKVALSTKVAGTADSVHLSDLTLTLDDTRMTGDVNVNGFADPAIELALAIDAINADRYLPPRPEGRPGAPPTPEAAAAGAAQLPLETLQALKLKGDLRIGQLQLSGARMSDVRITVNARDGRIAVDPATAQLYQGSYRGRIDLDARSKPPRLALDTALAGVAVGPLLKDYAANDKLEGTGEVSLQLTAAGADSDALVRTLNGGGRFALRDGVLHGIDARAALRQAELIIEQKSLGAIAGLKQQGGDTPFERLTGTLEIKNGVIFNRDLELHAPGILATGEGMVANLVTQEIKYRINVGVAEERAVTATETFNLGGYTVPIRCAGRLDNIAGACKPDFGEIAKAFAGKAVQDKLKELLGVPKQAPAQQATQQQPAAQQQQAEPQPQTPEDALKGVIEKGLKDLLGN